MSKFATSESFNKITHFLSGYMGESVCTDHMLEKLKKIKFNDYEKKVLNFITPQISVSSIGPSYSLYKIGIINQIPSHHVDVTGNINSMFYTTLQADDKHLFLNCLDIQSLFLFFVENKHKSKRYIFIPVVFGSEVNEVGHFAMLIFDNLQNNVYFADPNGKTTFFDDILVVHSEKHYREEWARNYHSQMYIDCEDLIEKLISFYISQFNDMCDMNFKFVSRKSWNKMSHCLNRHLSGSLIGSGHCVMMGTLIMNYLHVTNADVGMFFDLIGKLTDRELTELINAYSSGIYQFFDNYEITDFYEIDEQIQKLKFQ
jgi:hypothetical protein